jgi:hypothetical protein
MLIHPDVHLEIARQRHHDLLAEASRRRLANGLRRRRRRAAQEIERLSTARDGDCIAGRGATRHPPAVIE